MTIASQPVRHRLTPVGRRRFNYVRAQSSSNSQYSNHTLQSQAHRIRHQNNRPVSESQLTTISMVTESQEHLQISTTQPTTEPAVTTAVSSTSTLPRRNWLPDSDVYRALGVPEHWLSQGRKKRSIRDVCGTQLIPQQINRLQR